MGDDDAAEVVVEKISAPEKSFFFGRPGNFRGAAARLWRRRRADTEKNSAGSDPRHNAKSLRQEFLLRRKVTQTDVPEPSWAFFYPYGTCLNAAAFRDFLDPITQTK